MRSTAAIRPVGTTAGDQILDIADRAIVAGLDDRCRMVPEPAAWHPELHQKLGCFVTLTVRGELNGCVGSIGGEATLGSAVARHAWSAAFADPRLPVLTWSDRVDLDIVVSVLSPLAPLPAGSRSDLIDALRPGVDGLLLESGSKRAVFLPSVWEQLRTPDAFVRRLFDKAGLATDAWPTDLRASGFTVQKINRDERA